MVAVSFVPFQTGQSSYLVLVVSLAVLSLVAIDLVWMRILWVVLNVLCKRGDMRNLTRERIIFNSQLGVYVTSLLIGNLLTGIASMMNIAWVRENGITDGSFCSMQGGLSQVADVATAYFTATIAVHTFNTLVLRNRLPSWFCLVATVIGWAAAGIMGIVPANAGLTSGPFYGTDGATCGISTSYPVLQTVLHLVPVLIAALVSAVFYSLVFLIIRGTLVIRGGLKLNLDVEARMSMQGNLEYPQLIAAIASSMLWYPVAYVLLMFPHIIVCLLEASGKDVSFVWKTVADAGAAAIGLANVLVFYNMIRVMRPAFNRTATMDSNKTESFASPPKREESPVDVAPPVAAFMPPKAFPPPRSATSSPKPSSEGARPTATHNRQKSSGSESTRRLLSSHNRSASEISTAGHSSEDLPLGISLARTITPPGELSQMISAPPPAARKVFINDRSLPAPQRKERSAVLRRPTLSTVPSPSLDNSMLSAVPLKTAAPSDVQVASQRNSFINMYGSRSPASSLSSPEEQLARPVMRLNDTTMPSFGSPRSGSSQGYTTDSDSDVPRSAFGDRSIRPQRSRSSFRNQVEERLSMVEVPEPSGLSSLAWATLVADAATSNGGVSAAAKVKATRRRSKSMESLTVPQALLPRTPNSATMRRERMAPSPSPLVPKSATASVTRLDSVANFRDGPSRTPAYRTSSDAVRRTRTYR